MKDVRACTESHGCSTLYWQLYLKNLELQKIPVLIIGLTVKFPVLRREEISITMPLGYYFISYTDCLLTDLIFGYIFLIYWSSHWTPVYANCFFCRSITDDLHGPYSRGGHPLPTLFIKLLPELGTLAGGIFFFFSLVIGQGKKKKEHISAPNIEWTIKSYMLDS